MQTTGSPCALSVRAAVVSPVLVAQVLVLLAAAFLIAAFWLPFMHAEFTLALPSWMPRPLAAHVREWLIAKGRLPVGDHYLWGVIRNLFTAREYLVGWAILLFSVVFPVSKIILGMLLTAGAHWVSTELRGRLLRILAVTAKWSMADVFIVGMIIVFFKADGFHFTFTARPGIYCYAAAALLSSAAVSLIHRGSAE
jgi:hypothetical protein